MAPTAGAQLGSREKSQSYDFGCKCSALYRQGSNLESCVSKAVPSHSSHYPQDILHTQFSLYVHKGGLRPRSFYFQWLMSHGGHFALRFCVGIVVVSSVSEMPSQQIA